MCHLPALRLGGLTMYENIYCTLTKYIHINIQHTMYTCTCMYNSFNRVHVHTYSYCMIHWVIMPLSCAWPTTYWWYSNQLKDTYIFYSISITDFLRQRNNSVTIGNFLKHFIRIMVNLLNILNFGSLLSTQM